MSQQVFFDYKEPPPKALRRPDQWKPVEELPELHGVVGFDTETKDPGITDHRGSSWAFPGEGFVCGASFAPLDGEPFYIGIRHADGNIDPERFKRWLRAQAAKPDVTFAMANAPYDTGWAMNDLGVTFANTPYDVQGMATLIDENKRTYALDALGKEWLGYGKDDTDMIRAATTGGIRHPMSNMDKMPTWLVDKYGIRDAVLTIGCFAKMMPVLEQLGLQRVLELERESVMVAVDMRRRGVRVDLDKADQLRTAYSKERDELLEQVQAITGVALTAWDNSAIARALRLENPDVKLERTSTGKESVRAGVLESMATPVANMIVRARKLDKVVSTFLNGYIFGHVRNGRIHADFNPTRRSNDLDDSEVGVGGARFSSSNPNMQNIPNRTEEGRAVRECMVGEEGEDWMKLDYSSQEPRLTVHFAYLAKCRGAADMVARYVKDPNTDLHGETAALMNISRKVAKPINLGITYGMQGAKLCHELGLPTEFVYIERLARTIEVAGQEGKELLRKHSLAVPFVKEVFDLARNTAAKRGYVKTIMGRHCHFEKVGDEYMWTYKALNKIIQNSAAEQMKQALIMMRRANIPFLISVHDEAGLSRPRGEVGDRLQKDCTEIMEQAVTLSVPSVADVKVGASWGTVE